ncbi:hypothetical protein BT67DRAFT_390124 [Trichocladium antarcticum]|uniref:HAUS augmin-like complex subunit 6 N-terminal domain-containing protein n=1 Tax=Trichocladium antarcticum TaxID=1450529 RepID=A0AAN6ZA49_9PEZI|nr:hypothetical protein BT67DRAFT_390124 [Trichocladium antarcticum]
MAALNGTSLLARTRSARIPNTTKPVPISSRGAPSNVIASAHPPPQPTASPTTVSNVSLFLTNLRLLDLDRHPDWPDISALTFSARDAAQGQKRRIQSVEWALFHLFTLWDPEEARNKLRPFFPPADQVQSLNLRAALLRCLEQAKKNGLLGRDAVVRKTMLDECKGARVEEVLAVFSSAVLKKRVAEQQLHEGGHPALAQTLALDHRGYSGDRAELAALVLAHRVSLRRVLDEKNAARRRFKEFSDLLSQKEKDILRRREAAEAVTRAGQGKGISEDQTRDVCRAVRNNWTGDEAWMETLLYGDSKSHKDGLLSTPFDRVWRRVQSGRLDELEDLSAGLLEQLESRARGQQERLEKWKDFREKMFRKNGAEPASSETEAQVKPTGIDLGFRGHENLHLGRMSPKKPSWPKPAEIDSHYQALIDGLKSDLASLSPDVAQIPPFFQRPPQTERLLPRRTGDVDFVPAPETLSDISDLEDAPVPVRPSPKRREKIRVSEEPAFEPVIRRAKTFDEEHAYPYPNDEPPTPSRLRRSTTIQSHSPPARLRPAYEPPTRPPVRRLSSPPKPSPGHASPPRPARSPPQLVAASPEPPPSHDRSLSPTQELADQILASAASPPPVKRTRHTLSLAERTRLSMARRTSHANLRVPDDEDGLYEEPQPPEPPTTVPIPIPLAAPTSTSPPPPPPLPSPDSPAEYEDLVTRTRRSMAGYDAARKRAQLERRRSLRKQAMPTPAPAPATPAGRGSYFAAVDEDEEEGNTTLLAEDLMSGGAGEIDYEAVFMSRPRLKTSPVGTPVKGLW